MQDCLGLGSQPVKRLERVSVERCASLERDFFAVLVLFFEY